MSYGRGFENQKRETKPFLTNPKVILDVTDTEGTVLDNEWYGTFQLTLYIAGSAAVQIEKLEPGTESTWIAIRFDDEVIELTTAGDTLSLEISEADSYRLTTSTAGAKVGVANH